MAQREADPESETEADERDIGRRKRKDKERQKSKDGDRESRKNKSKKRKLRSSSTSASDSDSDSSASPSSNDDRRRRKRKKRDKKGKNNRKRDKKSKKSKKKNRSDHNLLLSEEEIKARKDAKKAAKIAAMFGYTNTENPFGDSNLTEQFVWDKKHKRDKSRGKKALSKREQQKQRLEEITRARERRKEREKEQEEYEKQKEEEARMREKDMFQNWEEKEEEFHLKQQRERSKIRIKQGRELPIDIIAKNLLLYQEYQDRKKAAEDGYFKDDSTILGDEIPMEVDEPYKVFEKMNAPDLEQVRKDILENKRLEESSSNIHANDNIQFWNALLNIVDDDIVRSKRRDNQHSGRRHEPSGIHEKVDRDVQTMLLGKSKAALEQLLDDVRRKLKSGDPGIDVDYWEAVSKGLRVAISKAIIDAKHASILKLRLKMLQEQTLTKREPKQEAIDEKPIKEKDAKVFDVAMKLAKADKQQLEVLQKLKAPTQYETLTDLYEATGVGSSVPVVNADEDFESRQNSRTEVLKRQAEIHKDTVLLSQQNQNVQMDIDALIRNQDVGEDEEVMPERDSVRLPNHIYSWVDRFKPRKPRYFNRVKTGYEWNKYNQTHYDTDNPPPKVVKGYKFNIFYPDLIDKKKVPYFKLEPADSPEFVIIRFKAGPPYEDIAFKIINKEWSKQSQHGFKCIFERGILHLYFNFKRVFYRK